MRRIAIVLIAAGAMAVGWLAPLPHERPCDQKTWMTQLRCGQ